MKRINLITPKTYFPLPFKLQRNISILIFLVLVCAYGFKYYTLHRDLTNATINMKNLEAEVENLKKIKAIKTDFTERAKFIETEFANVEEEYKILKKSVVIKDLMSKLTELVPPNLWISSLEVDYEKGKKLSLYGKSKNKDDIFLFLNNLNSMGKNIELISMSSEAKSEIFDFQVSLELP